MRRDATSPYDSGIGPNAPRLLSPLSTTYVSSHRPTLTWAAEPGVQHTVEICADPACTRIVQSATPNEHRFKPTMPLPIGRYFWRVRRAGGEADAVSHTWQFKVRARHDRTDYYYGHYLDVNGDGYDDVVAQNIPGVVHVLLGSPNGLIASRSNYSRQGRYAFFSSIGDVDGDGLSDVLMYQLAFTCDTCFTPHVDVYFGSRSDGLAESPLNVEAGGLPLWGGHHHPLGDVDGDGVGDFGFGNGGDQTIDALLYLGNRNRTNIRDHVLVRGLARAHRILSIGDINADGHRDFLLVHTCGEGTSLFNFGTFSFRGGLPATPLFDGPRCLERFGGVISVADVDGDGVLDIAMGPSVPHGTPTTYLRLTASPPGWSVAERYQLRRWDYSTYLQDFDADGYLDDLDITFDSSMRVSAVSVMFGSPQGWRRGRAFSLSETNGCTEVVGVGDFDENGLSDLLVFCQPNLYTVEITSTGEQGRTSLVAPFPVWMIAQ